MLIHAIQKTTRQTPRKLGLVASVVRKESLVDAVKQLSFIERRSSEVILKVIRQAIANAIHNHGAKFEQLSLRDIIINEGPRYRRFRAVSRGRAHNIIKRTSHIKVVLEIKEQKKLVDQKSKISKTKQVKQKVEQQKKVKSAVARDQVFKTGKQIRSPKISTKTKSTKVQLKKNIQQKVIKKQKKA